MFRTLILTFVLVVAISGVAAAQQQGEWLCDPQFENCRTAVLDLIRNERVGIDVAFWYMTDDRYRAALADAYINRKVPVRVLIDHQNALNSGHNQAAVVNGLASAGIPIRDKSLSTDLLHFKMMLFQGQNMVQFSKANYEPHAFVYVTANDDYHDEAVFYTNDLNITNSFRFAFDDLWTDTTRFTNFANVTEDPLMRRYPQVTGTHSSMNFASPQDNFVSRLVGRLNQETQRIDALAFRITDNRASDAILAARSRGIPVQLITDYREYRNGKSIWHAKHIDKFWKAGVDVKENAHAGFMHEASVVLRGLGEVIFGSSNWTEASAYRQNEHNYFYRPGLNKPWFFQWFADQFDRKWSDSSNYRIFQPLPPTKPINYSPQNVASGLGTTVTLTWEGGEWAHFYDIYLGTAPNPPRVVIEKPINPGIGGGSRETHTLTNLLPGTTYYWRIVGKTWAGLENGGRSCACWTAGPEWSFTTAGTPPGGGTGGTPWGAAPAAVPGVIQAEHFDRDGQNIAYNDTTSGNSGGALRPSENVDIGTTSDGQNGGYYVGWTRVGEWLKYTVNVAETRTYQLTVRFANVGTGAKFRIDVDNSPATGAVALRDTGGWDNWQEVVVNVPLSEGMHVIRLNLTASNSQNSGVGNYGYLQFQ